MQINYQEINSNLLTKLADKYGETAKNHIHTETGSYSVAALHGDVIIGFISTYTETLAIPLENEKDAYIDIIEVDEEYRRKGIARELICLTEKWASESGFSQIRAWSSQDRVEAIPMWHKLGYCMCPAKIWVEWCKQVVDGYYVAKKLN